MFLRRSFLVLKMVNEKFQGIGLNEYLRFISFLKIKFWN